MLMNTIIASTCKHLGAAIIVLSMLLFGTLFYIGDRSGDILFISWFPNSSDADFIRSILSSHFSSLPELVRYSLPDGLWMGALMLTILWIWDFRLHNTSLLWCTFIMLTGLALEAGQLIHLVPGYFDIHDLWMMLAGGLISISFTQIINQLWKKN